MNRARVILLPKRAQPFFGRHPWVFPGAIQGVEGDPQDGDEVDLVSSAGNFVARGVYNSRSKIRVRLYSWDANLPLDDAFFLERLTAAWRLRQRLFGQSPDVTAYRVVASEADGLSGLTVDLFDRWIVLQITSLGMGFRRERIAAMLMELTRAEGAYVRTERGVGKLEGLQLQDGVLAGSVPDSPVIIGDGAVRYWADLREGQKTGFFLDQRSNRSAVAKYLQGRTVLDAFCYSGGFSLHAAKAGAGEIEAVDVSEPALALAAKNLELNHVKHVHFIRADVFDHLAAAADAGRKFGAVILDPPKFARSRSAIPDALRGYRTLMSYALRLLEKDGILVMCCCTGLIEADMIEEVMAQVAVDAGRNLQILERRGQDVDHPVLVTCRETAYLKCFICRVE